MNRHSRSSSTVSYASSTTSKISTIWGPGTLTGKALEAFGEVTLRGIEALVIRRKLASLRSVFPHQDDTTIGNIEQVYDDVLELTRPHLYSKAVSQAALRLLLQQIGSHDTYHLINGLDQWPEVEIRLFLSQVMSTCVLDIERDDALTSNDMRQRLSNSNKEVLKLVPVIDFITDIVRRNHVACQAALEGGFFDMLLRIYVAFPTFYKYNAEERSCQSAMFAACQSAFKALSASALHAEIVHSHPVFDLWLRVDQLSPQDVSTTSEESLPVRCAAWRKTEAHLVKRRLMIIWSASSWSADNNAEFLVCADVVEFSRRQYYDSDVVDLALLTIFKYIVTGGNATRHLTVIFRRSPSRDTTHIVAAVVQLWLEYANTREPTDLADPTFESGFLHPPLELSQVLSVVPNQIEKPEETFYEHEKSLLFAKILKKQSQILPRNDTALFSIIHFLSSAAQQSMTIQWSFLDAGALAVVLIVFVDGVPILSDHLDAFRHHTDGHQPKRQTFGKSRQNALSPCISLSLISTEAAKLLDTARSPAFQVLLQTQIFTRRRRICLSLLDVLLGSGGGVDDMYTELRDIFEDILYP